MGKKNKKEKSELKDKKIQTANLLEGFIWELDSKQENIIIATFLLVVMGVFLYTMPPAMIGGDSGEFSAIACKGGIPHPPGYPLYAMLAHGFNLIFPFGPPGWRPNLLSSIFALFTIFFIYKTVRYKNGSIWGGILAGGLFAFSSVIWRYSNTSEVFSLNNLFVAILIWLYFTYEKGNLKKAYLGAFLLGLGLTNHHTIAFIGLPIVVAIVYNDIDSYRDWKVWLKLIGLGLLGLTPYSYLYFASLNVPELSWGDQTTWDGFMTHFLRKEFGTFKLNPRTSTESGVAIIIVQIFTFMKVLTIDVVFLGVVPLTLTLKRFWKEEKVKISLVTLIFYMFVFSLMTKMEIKSNLNLEVLQRFWQQSLIICYVWVGLGFELALRKFNLPKLTSPIFAVLLVLTHLGLNFKEMNFAHNDTFPTFGRTLLKPMAPNSVFLVHRDVAIFSSRYVQSCLDYRTDVNILVREQMKTDWYHRIVENNFKNVRLPSRRLRTDGSVLDYNLKEFFDANIDKTDIYITNFGKLLTDLTWQKDFLLMPWGMVEKVYRKSDFNFDKYITEALKTLPSFEEVEKLQKFIQHPWEKFTWPLYWNAFYNMVESISIRGQELQNKKYLEEAIVIYEKMNEVFVEKPEGFWKVLGVTYQRMQYFDNSYEAKKIEAFKKYIETKPVNDKQAPVIMQLIREFESRHNKKK